MTLKKRSNFSGPPFSQLQHGIDINEKGVKPDYTITFSHNDFMNNIDSQLVYAQKYLEKILKK